MNSFCKLIAISFLFISSAQAAYTGAVNSATGKAGLASVEASETPFGNPASLAYLTGYYFTLGYGSQTQQTVGEGQDLALSLTDNLRETILPTSFSYLQKTDKPEEGGESFSDRKFKISMGNFITEKLAFGLGLKHQETRQPNDSQTQFNVDTGFIFNWNKDIGMAAYFDNLIAPSDTIPKEYRNQQTSGVGASFNYKKFVRFKLDALSATNNAWNKPTVAGGVENYVNRWLVIRLGAQNNSEFERNLYTAGIGFVGPKFGLNYAYENSPQEQKLTRHSVDLAIPVW